MRCPNCEDEYEVECYACLGSSGAPARGGRRRILGIGGTCANGHEMTHVNFGTRHQWGRPHGFCRDCAAVSKRLSKAKAKARESTP